MKYFYFFIYIVLASLFMSCSGIKDIEIGEIEDVNLTRFANRAIEFEVSMLIDNTSSFRFRIIDVDLDLYVNNEYLGKISNVDNVLIPSKSSELYTFPLRVNFTNILRGAISMYNLFLDRQAEVVVKGNLGIRSFPFTRNIAVDEKTFIRLN